MNPSHERILRHFDCSHLPIALRDISWPVCELANDMVNMLYDSDDPAEVTAGLRKLLEAKDCFVRAFAARKGE